MPNPTSPDAVQLYQIVRGQIEHEDNLIGSRISWFVTSQSFLFSAYAIIACSIQPTSIQSGEDPKHVLLTIIPSVAIATAVSILLAILSGAVAMARLRRGLENILGAENTRALPAIQGTRATRVLGMASPVFLPLLFMLVWVFLLVKRLF